MGHTDKKEANNIDKLQGKSISFPTQRIVIMFYLSSRSSAVLYSKGMEVVVDRLAL